MTSTARPKLRWILLISLSIASTAAAAEAFARWAGTGVDSPIAAPASEAVEVTVGDLTSTERIDGTVEEAQSITVLHRIEGESPAQTSTQSSTQPSASSAAGATTAADVPTEGLASFAAAADADLAEASFVGATPPPECPPVGEPTTTTTTLTSTPTVTVTVPVDDGCDPTTTTTTPDTTTPDTTTPDTTTPDTTTPDTTTPDTTTPGAITTTTIPPDVSEPEPPGDGRSGLPALGGSGPSASRTASNGASTGAETEPETQIITSISAIGSPIALGDVIYTVDGQPVVALYGTQPSWRSLDSGVDDGTDVRQLEESLVDLGYDPDATITVDSEFDRDTEAAVERWQEGLGLEPTGVVELGSVVFVAADATVTAHLASVGDEVADGSAVASLSGSSHHVVIEVPTELQSIIAPGLNVDVAGTTGVVTVLRSAERDSATVVQALITPMTPVADATGTVVTVSVDVTSAVGATIVPAEALVSRLDGTYAVQVGSTDGPQQYVPVTVLAVSGGDVAVQSDQLDAGMTVLVPL